MAVRDPKTEWLRVAGYRAMTPQQRAALARGLIRSGRRTVERAIREQRPELSKFDFELELWNRLYGARWARHVKKLGRPGRHRMEDWQVVAQVIESLDANHIPYAIVGGYSTIYWGRPRFTQDADLLVALPASKIRKLVRVWNPHFVVSEESIAEAVRQRSEFNLIHKTEVFKTDLWILQNTPYAREVMKRRRRGALGKIQAYYQSPEDTILSKLEWCKLANFSERQFGDALGVYEIQTPKLDESYLDRWARVLQVQDLLARIRSEAVTGGE